MDSFLPLSFHLLPYILYTRPINDKFSCECRNSTIMGENQLNFLKKINFRELTALAVLIIAVFGVYSHTLDSSFHLDDERAIWKNPPVFMKEINWDTLTHAAFDSKITTRPVAHISIAFNYYFHQLDVRGYHAVNILIHIITGIFLYFLLKATLFLPSLREKYGTHGPVIIAFITTAIWLLHPIQTQSVSYVSVIDSDASNGAMIDADDGTNTDRDTQYGQSAAHPMRNDGGK